LVPGYPRDRKRREEYKQGFNTSGLFKFSRHPNFFAEQGVWVSFGLFGVLGLGGGCWGGRTGKYFPFTTFRRLIAHTRLTFIFLQSGEKWTAV